VDLSEKFNFLTPDQTKTMFENAVASIRVELKRPPRRGVLWVNERAITDDPVFSLLGKSVERYKRHLVDSCAFIASSSPSVEGVGWADRYGGTGIGSSGGSGRSVFLNGYHVKGVGKTPLIGAKADSVHSSGGAYLEEAIREAIYSEIMAQFPWSTIPTLAILDTGLFQEWPESFGWSTPLKERRVLIVRPSFIRPAHFERALGLILSDPKAGARDAERVKLNIQNANRAFRSWGLERVFLGFWGKWAEQIAHGFVHRMFFGLCTTSNVCLGGQLVDFGAARTRPSRGTINLLPGVAPSGNELSVLIGALTSVSQNLERYGQAQIFLPEAINKVIYSYNNRFAMELVRYFSGANAMFPCADDIDLDSITRITTTSSKFRILLKKAFSGSPVEVGGEPSSNTSEIFDYHMNIAGQILLSELGRGPTSSAPCHPKISVPCRSMAEFDREALQNQINAELHEHSLSPNFRGDGIGEIISRFTYRYAMWRGAT